MDVAIRTFRSQDVDFALAQTGREGWDATADALQTLLAHDPDGCFIAESTGKPIGMITTTRFVATAWIGNLIVVPEYRKHGVGHRLMSQAIGHLEAQGVKTMRLEADPMGISLYRRLGFVDEFETPRFRREPPHHFPAGNVDRIDVHGLPALRELDAECFGDDRGRLLGLLFKTARAVYGARRQTRLAGYAMVTPSTGGVRVGPWVASDVSVARELLQSTLAEFREDRVIIGVPEVNGPGVTLLETHGFDRIAPSLRMIRGIRAAGIKPGGLYAIANGAVG